MSKHFDLETFAFNGHALRCTLIDGKPWFALPDIAASIGMPKGRSATSNARRVCDPEEVLSLDKAEATRMEIAGRGTQVERLFRNTHTARVGIVSESGLYKIILRAQRTNPAAKEFQDWITKHVIPAVRKDGGYVKDEEKVATGEVTAQEVSANLWKFFAKKLEVLEAIAAPLRKSANDMQQERLAVIEEQRAIRELIEKNERRIAELEARQGAAAARLKVVAWQKEQILTAKEALKKADNPTDYGVAA